MFLKLSILALTIFTSVYPQVANSESAPTRYLPSISVAFLATEKGEIQGAATAFAVDEDHFITAGHFCVAKEEAEKEAKAKFQILLGFVDKHGAPTVMFNSTPITWSLTPDICVMSSPQHKQPYLQLGSSKELEVGDEVMFIGAPRGVFPVVCHGTIISLTGQPLYGEPKNVVLISAMVHPGNSGSPVIFNGQVIGVVVAFPARLRDVALLTPVEAVKEALNVAKAMKAIKLLPLE
jgi:S1-C subfamily serine protease